MSGTGVIISVSLLLNVVFSTVVFLVTAGVAVAVLFESDVTEITHADMQP